MESVKKKEGISTTEMGFSGLEVWAGLVHEENLTELRGSTGRKTYKEMSSNDAVIGSMLYAIEMFLRPVVWSVRPFDESTRSKKDAELVEGMLGDMSHTMSSFISEWMAAPVYGFAPFEIVWKIRNGYKQNSDDSSKYSDGKLGIAKLAIRHPDTLHEWEFDGHNKLVAMIQRPAPTYEQIRIPISKMLLFTVLQRKGNPEGTSLLRRAYVAWYRKKRVEEIEAIGIERELAGLPMFTTPAQWWADDATDAHKALLAEVKKMARRIRQDEQAAIVIPAVYDSDGNQILKFELVSTGGTRAIDTGPAKEYYSRQMAMSILADVILMGHEAVGSFALSDSKTNLFSGGLGSLLDGIKDVLNKDLVPKILSVNGRDPSRPPVIQHGDIETPDLDIVGEYVSRIAAAGLPLFPTEDGELERHLFRIAGLPEEAADSVVERANEDKKNAAEQAEQMREWEYMQAESETAEVSGNAGEQPGPPQVNNSNRGIPTTTVEANAK